VALQNVVVVGVVAVAVVDAVVTVGVVARKQIVKRCSAMLCYAYIGTLFDLNIC